MNSTTAALPIAKRMRAMGFWVIRGTITQRRYWILAAVGLLLPLIGWGTLSATGIVNPVFLPGPVSVLARIGTWYSNDDLLGDIWISTLRVVSGWALSARNELALP